MEGVENQNTGKGTEHISRVPALETIDGITKTIVSIEEQLAPCLVDPQLDENIAKVNPETRGSLLDALYELYKRVEILSTRIRI